MNPDASPAAGTNAKPWRRLERDWDFVAWFALVGFYAGGMAVFLVAVLAPFPPPSPPLPPGAAGCGNCVLGDLFRSVLSRLVLIVVGAPLAAVDSAMVAGVVGALLDCVWRRFEA
ncbi:MAG: hypothetical protein SH850_08530 [Planctomycetaceae bacterium]|nr:hypothetical protein [Planctomycetaceae bacterium]